MILVRNFLPSDLPVVYDIETKSFPDPYDALFLLNLYQMYPETFLVAEMDSLVMGYVISRTVGHRGHILAIAVSPPFRGRDIGRRLMEDITARLKIRNVSAVWLEVRVSNEKARRFYEGLGFRAVRTIPRYYSDGENAIILEKFI